MNAYKTSRLVRPALALLVPLAIGACTGDEGSDSSRLLELAMPETAQAAPAPEVLGEGSGLDGATTADTIDLRRIGYSRGAANAPVTVFEFSDFGCPFCATFSRFTYPGLHRDFVATGKVRWVYVPFVMGMFPNGEESARAAECAAEQEKFWEMHDLLFATQKEWKASRDPERVYAGYARQVGLDPRRFASCYREDRGAKRTAINNRAADALRVRATPSFLINGRLVEGALPEAQFRAILTQLSNR